MKWKYYPLPDDDEKAKRKFLWNVETVAHTHTLARKLLPRLADATGPMFLVAQESLDVDRIDDYRWAGTYKGGQLLNDAVAAPRIPIGEQSTDGLAKFIEEHLRRSSEAIVMVGSLAHRRANLLHWRLADSRYGYFGDEAYPILTAEDLGQSEVVREAISIGQQWTTGLCSRVAGLTADLPLDIDLPESLLNEVVANCAHLFTLALDDEGYLVWCIGAHADRQFLRDFLMAETATM